jgi:hypothetical protein
MRSDEIRDTGALLGTALDEVAVLTRDVHRAVANRVFAALGTAARPVQLMHDGIAAIAYTSTRVGVRVVPAAAGLTTAAVRDPAAPSLHDDPRGRFVVGAVNGFWGDRLGAQRPALAAPLRIRTHGGPLRATFANAAHDAGPDASGRLVVFLHGLCETDLAWWLGATANWGDRDVTFGSKLREDDGWTPLYVTLNSGRHISDNARDLADGLEQLVAAWPVPVTDVALVGHSMGGLIARSAAHHGAGQGHAWAALLRHIVGLGAPHTGAPLERLVARGTHLLSVLPETRPFAEWLDRRSVGIQDLRHGAIVDADWRGGWDAAAGHCPQDGCLDDRCTDVPLAAGVQYSMASATLSRRPDGAFAHDLLVHHSSAHGFGAARRIAFDPDRRVHIGNSHHFHLLSDPRIYAALREWLATPASGRASVGSQHDAAGRSFRRRGWGRRRAG